MKLLNHERAGWKDDESKSLIIEVRKASVEAKYRNRRVFIWTLAGSESCSPLWGNSTISRFRHGAVSRPSRLAIQKRNSEQHLDEGFA